ncbi:MAG: sortase [Candidatus Dojkabacteria bacterium]|nr:MAG: sortase [Candidatus Dojkabacteria bacterium]
MQYYQNERQQFLSQIGRIYTAIGAVFVALGLIFVLIPAFPYIYYSINPDATEDEIATLTISTVAAATPTPTPSNIPVTPTPTPAEPILPPVDPNLPKTNTLLIPSIGVNGPIHEGQDSKRALYRGMWRTPDWGNPEDFTKPTVLAAHRFGYIEWTNEFRKTNSFFNLPKLKPGDTFTVIWNQRKFEYVVRRVEEVTLINPANTDMILYTCKYLKSPIRIVIFADRTNSGYAR